jgi:hypothetical protein
VLKINKNALTNQWRHCTIIIMKKKLTNILGTSCFLILAVAVSRCDMSPVCVSVSLFVLCLFAMLGFGWIGIKNKNPQ